MRAALALAPLLVALLAGCAGSPGADGAGGPTPADIDVDSTSMGAISGVVVDEAIRPLPGATVRLITLGRNATADADGLFSFTDLAPGFYAMLASAPLYFPAQVTADVVAGGTAKVKVQLTADGNPQPFKVTYKHEGHMQAWAGIAEYEFQEVAGQAAPLCDCRLNFTPEAVPSTIVYEAVWEETVASPTGAEYYWVVEQAESGARDEAYCSSPCYARIRGGDYEAGKAAYARLDGADEWPAATQPFQIFLTLFYNGEAPPGWSVVNGDA